MSHDLILVVPPLQIGDNQSFDIFVYQLVVSALGIVFGGALAGVTICILEILTSKLNREKQPRSLSQVFYTRLKHGSLQKKPGRWISAPGFYF